MKKILLVIVILFVLASAALAFFVLTFDINRYKAAIEKQLSAVVGNPVVIGRLSLAWKGLVIAGIENFNIYTEEAGQRTSALSFERASAVVDILPLLRKQLQISSLSVERLSLEATRTKEGKIEIRGYNTKPAASAAEKTAPETGGVIGFGIDNISVRDSTIRFYDMTTDLASDITIKHIDADIKNVSLDTPIKFSVKMALASDQQNVTASGVVGGLASGNISLKDFAANTDLGTFRYEELVKALPAIQKIGLREGPAGLVDVKVRELVMDKNRISTLWADVEYANGRVNLSQCKVPIERINLSASAAGNTLTVKSFSAKLAGGTVNGSGTIDDYLAAPRTTAKITADVKGLSAFLADVLDIRQKIDGDLSLTFDGTMAGKAWPEISKTIDGGGAIGLERGVIIDTNVAAQTLDALTIFPGLLQTVTQFVPARVQQSLNENYTVLKPIKVAYTVKERYVHVPDLKIQTDFADFIGSAQTSLTGDVSSKGTLRFSQDISTALVKAVSSMQYLADAQGLIEFPLAIKGGGGVFKVIPDLKYVGQKVAVQKAQEVATDFLKKAMGPKDGTQAGQGSSSGQTKLEDFLKTLMTEEKKTGQ